MNMLRITMAITAVVVSHTGQLTVLILQLKSSAKLTSKDRLFVTHYNVNTHTGLLPFTLTKTIHAQTTTRLYTGRRYRTLTTP